MIARPRTLHLGEVRLGAGVLLTVLALAVASALLHATLLLAPFAATAALKHASPHGPLARPRNVIGGYLVGASVGLAIGLIAPGDDLGAAVGAALAATLMARLDVDHPPAVAMTVLAVQTPVPWILQAAAGGALLMTASMVVFTPLVHRRPYPAGVSGRTGR
ncbi:MAG: HPP family protein [Patulibacter minatonensis]